MCLILKRKLQRLVGVATDTAGVGPEEEVCFKGSIGRKIRAMSGTVGPGRSIHVTINQQVLECPSQTQLSPSSYPSGISQNQSREAPLFSKTWLLKTAGLRGARVALR